MKKLFGMAKETFSHFLNDNCPQMAASLSYATVFALPPLLVLLLAGVGVFVDPQDLQGRIVTEMEALLGADGARTIGEIITASNQPGRGAMAIASIVMLLVGATGAFVQLQDALNTTWRVKPDPKKGGIKAFIGKRMMSFGMIFVIGFLLLISFVVAALVTAFADVIVRSMGDAGVIIAQAIQIVLGFVVAWGLFAALFKVLPDAEISWKDVRMGAFVTALVFSIGRVAIGFYLGHSKTASAFGAAAALAVLLIWIYYAAVIVLLGAEFTRVWATHHGRAIEPEEGAVRIGDADANRKSA
jgi:membrane protein